MARVQRLSAWEVSRCPRFRLLSPIFEDERERQYWIREKGLFSKYPDDIYLAAPKPVLIYQGSSIKNPDRIVFASAESVLPSDSSYLSLLTYENIKDGKTSMLCLPFLSERDSRLLFNRLISGGELSTRTGSYSWNGGCFYPFSHK